MDVKMLFSFSKSRRAERQVASFGLFGKGKSIEISGDILYEAEKWKKDQGNEEEEED